MTKAPGESQSTTYTYDPAGAQMTASDVNGTITTRYDEAGRTIRSTDSYGAESSFAYDAEGRHSTETKRQARATGRQSMCWPPLAIRAPS